MLETTKNTRPTAEPVLPRHGERPRQPGRRHGCARRPSARLVSAALAAALLSLAAAPARATPAEAPAAATIAMAPADPGGGPGAATGQGPIEVQVLAWLLDVRDLDFVRGDYAVDATLELRWRDARLAVDAPVPFEIMNANEVHLDSYGYEAEGDWHTRTWRVHGRMRANLDLRHYPFDIQALPLVLEHPLWQSDAFVLHPETTFHPPAGLQLARDRLGPDFTPGDWQLRGLDAVEGVASYGLGETYSRYTMVLRLGRDPLRFFLVDLLPIALMVLLGLAASLIPPDKIDAKLLLTVLALLVAVELQVAATERLPPLGYLTLVDWVYGAAYVSIGVAVLQAIGEYRHAAAGRLDRAGRLRRVGATLSLLVFALPVGWRLAVAARGAARAPAAAVVTAPDAR
jgi:hypothetical protein